MKNVITILGLVLLYACGAQTNGDSAVKDAQASSAAQTEVDRLAFPMSGLLGNVQAQSAQNGASGLWTDIEVKYSVDCMVKFETFTYALRPKADGHLDLLVSAIGTRQTPAPALSCQSIMLVTKKVTVPGIVAKDSIRLVNLTGAEAKLAKTTKSLTTIDVKITAVHNLCPIGAPCMPGHDNTIVSLTTTKGISCVDGVAPVTFATTKAPGGKLLLAVSATQTVDSRLMACAAFPKTVEITLPHTSANLGDIELTVVGGAQ